MLWIAYASLVLWTVLMISLAPSAWRYGSGRYNLIDSYRTGVFFMAMLWVGGVGRLIFLPTAEGVRLAILALSCALAIYLLVLARQGRIQ